MPDLYLMSFQSLKFKITANLAFIILLSVLLSDFVIITVIQKSLIQERVSKGRQLLSVLPEIFYDHRNSNMELRIAKIVQEFDALVCYFGAMQVKHFELIELLDY